MVSNTNHEHWILTNTPWHILPVWDQSRHGHPKWSHVPSRHTDYSMVTYCTCGWGLGSQDWWHGRGSFMIPFKVCHSEGSNVVLTLSSVHARGTPFRNARGRDVQIPEAWCRYCLHYRKCNDRAMEPCETMCSAASDINNIPYVRCPIYLGSWRAYLPSVHHYGHC